MKNKDITPFEQSRQLAALASKDYAKDFLAFLVMYQDISASEAASRLNIHIKTAQDFLEGLEEAGILGRRKAAEGKRPYFRYSLKEKSFHITFDLEGLYDRQGENLRRFQATEKDAGLVPPIARWPRRSFDNLLWVC